jgi:uncharacterized repeat protein (TIGR01451 family)
VKIAVRPTTAGVLRNTVTLTSDQVDPVPGNSIATAGNRILPRRTALRVTKRGPKRVRGGQYLNYRICVRNRGRHTAIATKVRDRIPRGVFWAPRGGLNARHIVRKRIGVTLQRGGVLVFNAGDLRPRQRRCTTIRMRVARSLRGRLTNVAVANASNAKRTRAVARTRVRPRTVTILPAVTG